MAGNDQKLTQDAAEHTLPTGNWPGTWRNTLCRPEINPRRCGTHSADRKLTWDAVEHSLLIGNRPGIWRNTLFWPEINLGHGVTPSAGRKSTWDVVEHSLTTGNRPGMWWNTLCQPEIDRGHGGTQRVRGLIRLPYPKQHCNTQWSPWSPWVSIHPWCSVAVRDYERKALCALRFFL